MDAQIEPARDLVVTPRLLALLDERERQIAESKKTDPGKTLEQVLDEIFGPDVDD